MVNFIVYLNRRRGSGGERWADRVDLAYEIRRLWCTKDVTYYNERASTLSGFPVFGGMSYLHMSLPGPPGRFFLPTYIHTLAWAPIRKILGSDIQTACRHDPQTRSTRCSPPTHWAGPLYSTARRTTSGSSGPR